ncbi:DsbA family protein [Bradymonas sediminis]|nr:thioredoxin domain-containing protein [Bradymonas sediminis]
MAQENSGNPTARLLVIVVVALIAFAGGFFVSNMTNKSGNAGDSGSAAVAPSPSGERGTEGDGTALPIGDSFILGKESALVTVVEFSDFQCPFCARGATTMEQLQKKYPDDVKVVFKHYPLPMHPQATPASYAAIAAGNQGKFWEMHDWLFKNQKEIRNHGDDMKEWAGGHAKTLGLDIEKFNKDFDDPKTHQIVKDDMELGGKVAVRGTPHFFVNGERVVGAKPLAAFEEIVEAHLKEAKSLMKGGVARADVYGKMVAKNFDGGKADNKPSAAKPAGPSVEFIPVESNDPVFGNTKDPLVTIVEFSDFQCPFCSKVVPTVKQIKEEYGNEVRFVFKQLPLAMHAEAKPAARASLAADRQGKFWEMHDLLFEKHREFKSKSADFEGYAAGLAEQLGLNVAKFKKDYNDPAIAAQVERDLKLAGKVGARGTPNFWINGVNLRGAQPFPSFKAEIDKQIKLAKELKASKKLSGDDLYKALVEKNKASAPKAPAAPAAPAAKVDVKDLALGNAPILGPKNAPVTIVEYSDFECPYCKRGDASLKEAIADYDGKVKVAFKHYPLPFHKKAPGASKAAMAAGEQGKFWEMHDLLFENQRNLGSDDTYIGYAEKLGLNVEKFKKDLKNPEYQKIIDADMAQGSKVGVRGTPAFFINGERLVGAQPASKFKEAIDRALKEAK